jgi:peptide deformylase
MNKTEFDAYLTKQEERNRNNWLTRREREELADMKSNPKKYIKEDSIIVPHKKIIIDLSILKIPCEKVEPGENVSEIIEELKKTFNANKAWGVAANQIGYTKAVAYVKVPDYEKQGGFKELILINPKIIQKEEMISMYEACLSFPKLTILTDRYNLIAVQRQDEQNRIRTSVLTGALAIATQHEIDHLNGLTILDRKHRAK